MESIVNTYCPNKYSIKIFICGTKEKKCKNAKWLSEEALQRAVKREAKSKGEKEKYTHLNAEFQRIARRDKKPSSMISAKKWRKTIERERLEIS